jgi:hypothetical protein
MRKGYTPDNLLAVSAWCRVHDRRYPANHYVPLPGVGRRIEANDCPDCVAERAWVRKAQAELEAEGVETTSAALLARAEKLAGRTLLKYKRHD